MREAFRVEMTANELAQRLSGLGGVGRGRRVGMGTERDSPLAIPTATF